ncbi:hypothetical protein D3C77_365930 [compost metagenome]
MLIHQPGEPAWPFAQLAGAQIDGLQPGHDNQVGGTHQRVYAQVQIAQVNKALKRRRPGFIKGNPVVRQVQIAQSKVGQLLQVAGFKHQAVAVQVQVRQRRQPRQRVDCGIGQLPQLIAGQAQNL